MLFLLRWQQPDNDDLSIAYTQLSIDDNTIICDEKYDVDDDNVNVVYVVDDNINLDQEYSQLMITVGTCLGFTITCFYTSA